MNYSISERTRWNGSNSEYHHLHYMVRKMWGKPVRCERCGTTTAKRISWANINHQYRLERSDWLTLCASCHIKHDKNPPILKKFCIRGHEFEKDGFYVYKKSRKCKPCHQLWRKHTDAKNKKN